MQLAAAALLAVSLVTFVTGPARAGVDPLLLDIHGDGLRLDGTANTNLLGNTPLAVSWTVPNTDDCWLMVDATSIQAAGYIIRGDGSAPLEGPTLFRDGLRITVPGETEVAPATGTGGRDVLIIFDQNQDGVYTSVILAEQPVPALRSTWGEIKQLEW